MTLMSPQDFHDLFDRAVDDGPPSTYDDVAAGRRLLRRRRLASSAAVCAAVVAVAGGGYALAGSPGGSESSGDVAGRPAQSAPRPDEAAWVEACRNGEAAPATRSALFDAGVPVVKASEVNDVQVTLALQAADGSHWGECTVSRLPGAEPKAGLGPVYQAGAQEAVSTGPVSTWTRVCEPGAGEEVVLCGTFNISYVDRVPEEVEAVRFLTMGGQESVVHAEDGFVVLNLTATVPDPSTITELSRTTPLLRVVYLDASGTPIAGEDRSAEGGRIDGLPHLSAYPSLRGPQVPELGPS